jgi:ABC-type uncharacterized transport system permease subunit
MNPVIPGILASVLYLLGASLQLASLRQKMPSRRAWVIGSGVAAVTVHAWFSWQDIFTSSGIDMGLMPMASLTSLAIAAIITASSFRRPVENLAIVLFPMAAICIVLSLALPDAYTPRSRVPVGIAMHIVLSVIAYSILTIAAFQAMLLSFGDYELKHHKLAVLKSLPPLLTMEWLLFELLWAGLLFLSLSISTGFYFMARNEGAIPGLVHHTLITLAAWMVFAVLLWGRYQRGWRGATASRWTLAGFVLLVVGYFGSKFVLEIVLGRA